jgi:hypothetical protein
MVMRKLEGAVAYDEKTGKITLTYDFKSAAQLKDFELNGAERGGPSEVGLTRIRCLNVRAFGFARHIVKFKDVVITGTAIMKATKGNMISASGGAALYLEGPRNSPIPTFFCVKNGVNSRSWPVPVIDRQGSIPIGLNIEPLKLTARFGSDTWIIITEKSDAGFIEFLGGDAGYIFGQLRLTGTMDEEWAQEYFVNSPSSALLKGKLPNE